MKKILNISLIALFSLLIVSCENTDDPRFQDNPELGFVQLTTTDVTTTATAESISFALNLVGTITEPLRISYEVEAVQGDFTQYLNTTSGTITINPGDVQIVQETLELVNMEAFRDSETVFNVNITGSSNPNIGLGLGGASATHKFTIPCNEPSTLADLLAFKPDYLTGDYELTDGTVNGLGGLAGIFRYFHTLDADDNIVPQIVTLLPGATASERVFDAIIFNGLGFARLRTFTIEIIEDDNLGGNTVIFKSMDGGADPNSTGLGCGIPILIEPIPAADADEVSYTEWSTCNGEPTFEINYVENSLGSCGEDVQFSTFILNKVTP